MAGAVVEAVGDMVAAMIAYFFVRQHWEQCGNGAPSLVGVRRHRILLRIVLQHHNDLKLTGR